MREISSLFQFGIRKSTFAVGAMAMALAGCHDTPGFYPNQDVALRKPIGNYRMDAARRTYPADAPRVRGLAARSQIGYVVKAVDVANLSDEDWNEVEVWVNKQYVCYLPRMEKGVLKSIPFDALYDGDGHHVPTGSRTFIVETVEVFFGGKLYDMPVRVAY